MRSSLRARISALVVPAIVCALSSGAQASETEALAISANIQARHLPFGTVLDPIHASPASTRIVGYTRCGDSALWTGAYLAAEAFRYKVTQSADALKNVRTALAGLRALADVTGDNRLARCLAPAGSPYAGGIASEEAQNSIHQNYPWIWVDNTSRDQIVGAFFGLGVAFDFVDDTQVRNQASELATRLIGFIADHQWSPNDEISSTFLLRPEALHMLVQVARHVNPSNPVTGPLLIAPVQSAVLVDVQSNSSYFKFNLAYMSLYHLIRLQNTDDNRSAYRIVRNYTASHQNAFFNMIDRALTGPNAARDAETRALLDQWLERPRRDFYVDLTGTVQVCGSEACRPLPVPLRPPTDFLWQRNPFQLTGGGSGIIESSGIDYILPYWMARYYGVIPGAVVQSAAAPSAAVAANSIASLYGANLAPVIAQATSQPLPAKLGGATLTVVDAAGAARSAPLLYVSPTQINFVVPNGTVPGTATLQITSEAGSQSVVGTVASVVPRLFSMNGTGSGVAAANAITTQAGNPQVQLPVQVFQCIASGCTPVPIRLGADQTTYVSFYGTGIRNRSSPANVTAAIKGMAVPVLYAGPTPEFTGLDQVNVVLPLGLRGSGEAPVILTVDGQSSNAVTINIQ